ncbi:hypothetical protein DIPPA_27334 [Diplonema papillatum]|nr:hypothetical protein DIPPA_27334 [Diplonema papillatum]|eukprot:gene14663-22423_t
MDSGSAVFRSELEQVKQQLSGPLFAPEVEAAIEVMAHRLQRRREDPPDPTSRSIDFSPTASKRRDETLDHWSISGPTQGGDPLASSPRISPTRRASSPAKTSRSTPLSEATPLRTPKPKRPPTSTPQSLRTPQTPRDAASVPRSARRGHTPPPHPHGTTTPQAALEKNWDPYFARPSTSPSPARGRSPPGALPGGQQGELQRRLVDYYERHNADIERAEKKLEAELKGIDGIIKRRKTELRIVAQAGSPRRKLYQTMPRPRSVSASGRAGRISPKRSVPRPQDVFASTPGSVGSKRRGASPASTAGGGGGDALQLVGPENFLKPAARPFPTLMSPSQSSPHALILRTPPPQFQADPAGLIEQKLQHIRQQLSGHTPSPSPQQPAEEASQQPFNPSSATSAQPTASPPGSIATASPRSLTPMTEQPMLTASPTITGPDVAPVIDMLHRSQAARKQTQPAPLHHAADILTPGRKSPPGRRRVGPGGGAGPLHALNPNEARTGVTTPSPQLSMEEILHRLNEKSEPGCDRTEHDLVAPPPPVDHPHAPHRPKRKTVTERDVLEVGREPLNFEYNPSIRPMALPKSSYNARRKWEQVTYSTDAAKRLMVLKDEARECENETKERITGYGSQLVHESTATSPAPMDKNNSVSYPPPPLHSSNMDRTEAEAPHGEGPHRLLDNMTKALKKHNESGEKLLATVGRVDELVDQLESIERTKPEARDALTKEGALRTLRRNRSPAGDSGELQWKDVWVEADASQLRFYPVGLPEERRGHERPLGRVVYNETARVCEDLGTDGVYYYFGLERHSGGKVSLFTLCSSSPAERRAWCMFLSRQMAARHQLRLTELPEQWSNELPFEQHDDTVTTPP